MMSDQQDICRWCSTPYRFDCKYCSSYCDSLKVKGDVIRELKLELLGYQELQMEHFRLKKQHQRLRQQFDKLKDVYYNQIELIYMLKKNVIKNIGKI